MSFELAVRAVLDGKTENADDLIAAARAAPGVLDLSDAQIIHGGGAVHLLHLGWSGDKENTWTVGHQLGNQPVSGCKNQAILGCLGSLLKVCLIAFDLPNFTQNMSLESLRC